MDDDCCVAKRNWCILSEGVRNRFSIPYKVVLKRFTERGIDTTVPSHDYLLINVDVKGRFYDSVKGKQR